MRNFLLLIAVLLLTRCNTPTIDFNGDFEKLDKIGHPIGWLLNTDSLGSYIIGIDSNVKRSGKYSLTIEKTKGGTGFRSFGFPTKTIFKGDNITLSGYIKTQDVTSGFAGLWMRVEDIAGHAIAQENMYQYRVSGTKAWKKFSVAVPYNSNKADKLIVGGVLVGNGKVWFDQLEITVDGEEASRAKTIDRKRSKAESDTSFQSTSGLKNIKLYPQQVTNLTVAGQFWSFLKYHHPAIARGEYNWDAELFRLLPTVINAPNSNALSDSLETFLKKLPVPTKCQTCAEVTKKDYELKPDYGSLFDKSILRSSLINRLDYIKNNRNIGENFYVMMTAKANPNFDGERAYRNMPYPDLGYRILALYRYWGIINYFFPSRNLIGEDWNAVLAFSLLDFINARNEKEYLLAVMKLVSRIKDSHAAVMGTNLAFLELTGRFALPIEATFVGSKLVIFALHSDTLGIRKQLFPGDEIVEIDDIPVDQLIKNRLPYTSASNYDTQLRNLSTSLLRSDNKNVKLLVARHGKLLKVITATGAYPFGAKNIAFDKAQAYRIIGDSIGYVFPGKYRNSMLPDIIKLFKKLKGVVVDMRCYPQETMAYSLGNYIKANPSLFAKVTGGSVAFPGSFTIVNTMENGYKSYTNDEYSGPFKGKIVVIVNSTTQSQAEFTTMAFQSSGNVKVVGSTTAGADGDASAISLPGGLMTWISGLGVFYPDGTPAQRTGVKIDYKIYPTVKGIESGKDELMEKAIQIINSGIQ